MAAAAEPDAIVAADSVAAAETVSGSNSSSAAGIVASVLSDSAVT